MADPASTGIPTLTISDILAADPSAAWDPANVANYPKGMTEDSYYKSLGLGQPDTNMVPAFLQTASQDPNNSVPESMSSSAAFQYDMQNGYLQGDPGGSSVSGGYKAEGVDSQGPGKNAIYNPSDPNNIGVGFQSGGTSGLLIPGANPWGINPIAQGDVHEIYSPTQAPQDFKAGPYGTTAINPNDLAQNQDFWSKYFVPGLQIAASAAFGGGLNAITGGASAAGMGTYNVGSGVVQGLAGGTSPTQIAENVGAGLAGNALAGYAGANGIPPQVMQLVSPVVRGLLQRETNKG